MVTSQFTLENSSNSQRPLESLFRNRVARLLDFFIINERFDYSTSQVSKLTRIPLRTVQRSLPRLVEMQVIRGTNKIGNTNMYALNKESRLAKALANYVFTTININIEKAKKSHL
jgi:hypothetical protein